MNIEKLLSDKLPYHIQNLDNYLKKVPEYNPLPHHKIKPYVGYSFIWFSAEEYSKHLELKNIVGFNEDSRTYTFIKGKPIFDVHKEEQLFNKYIKDSYVDLKEMYKDLSVDLSTKNMEIHRYIVSLIKKANLNGFNLEKKNRTTFSDKIIDWLYSDFMYELRLSEFDSSSDNYFNSMAEIIVFQRRKASEINYRLNLISYLLRLKKNKGNNSFSNFSKFLDETTTLKNTIKRMDIVLKAIDLKKEGMSVIDVFDYMKKWLFDELNFTNDELKYHFGFELHTHDEAHNTFKDFVNRAFRKSH